MRRFLLMAAILIAALLVGCDSKGPTLLITAIDSSDSARPFELGFLRAVRDENQRLPLDGTQVIFRFDNRVHEIHRGGALEEKQLKEQIREALAYQSPTKGTSIYELSKRIDHELKQFQGKSRVLILTDCGVELMTKDDFSKMKELTAKWKELGVEQISVIGVRPLHREAIRDGFSGYPGNVQIESSKG